jgi:uncharacterized protein (TIGR02646 family)
MIQIRRSGRPTVLDDWRTRGQDLCDARKIYYQDLARYNAQTAPKPSGVKADSAKYAHREVRQQLEIMFGNKCCYCESNIKPVTYKAVEHFRPQAVYPLIAYKWENLLISCPSCNSDYKKGQFPLMTGANASADKTNPELMDDTDANALIDPTREDPSAHIKFEREVMIGLNYRGQMTIDVCNLNREDLREHRRAQLEKLKIIIDLYNRTQKDKKPDALDAIVRHISIDKSYIACKKDFIEANTIV